MTKRRSDLGSYVNTANQNDDRRLVPLLLDKEDVAIVDAHVDKMNANRKPGQPKYSRSLVLRLALGSYIKTHNLTADG